MGSSITSFAKLSVEVATFCYLKNLAMDPMGCVPKAHRFFSVRVEEGTLPGMQQSFTRPIILAG